MQRDRRPWVLLFLMLLLTILPTVNSTTRPTTLASHQLTALSQNQTLAKASFWIQNPSGYKVPLSPQQVDTWNRTYGGSDVDIGYAVVECQDGGFAIAGSTYSFGNGQSDFWLLGLAANGTLLWNQTYGGAFDDRGYSVVECHSGGFAITGYTHSWGYGYFSPDTCLIRTDTTGNLIWNQTLGEYYSDSGYGLIECHDGGFAIAGFTNIRQAYYIEEDVRLIRTYPNGTLLWDQTYGGEFDDRGYSIVECQDGGFVIAGITESFGNGRRDFWLLRIATNGTLLWNQTYGGEFDDWGYSVVECQSGGFALTGSTSGSYNADDVWLVRTDAAGNLLWSHTYGTIRDDVGRSVVELRNGGFAILGYTPDNDGFLDIWVIRTDIFGNLLWNQTFGGTGTQWAHSVIACQDDSLAIVGYHRGADRNSEVLFLRIHLVTPQLPLPALLNTILVLVFTIALVGMVYKLAPRRTKPKASNAA